ncbi:BTAD domain-containing putative transcriptional regulator [Amycolatopsis sp. cmx-4-83]|uniref:BTAD domain-containing putative transcriptional regulator n=1 Tax=Amycolatopsis sp. cmx-4-83 TaxID=2790940 RepID=UPI00397B12A6
MRFNVLGPLEIVHEESAVELTGLTRRATLAMLVLHANEPVGMARLQEALWPKSSPPTARKMIQNAVSGLRTLLPPGGPAKLARSSSGYQLSVEPGQVDSLRWDELVRAGRVAASAGDFDRAAMEFGEALGLWRGPVLSDLVEEGLDWPELEALRGAERAVTREWAQAALAAGWHEEVVGELAAAVLAEPLDEELRRRLMLALYRSGRQAEALEVYRAGRDALAAELGLDPGLELRRMERAILAHDQWLWTPEAAGVAAAPEPVAALRPQPAAAEVVPAVPAAPEVPAALVRKWVSVLAVRPEPAAGADADIEDVAAAREELAAVLRTVAERFGGLIREPAGTRLLAVFGVPKAGDDDAERAVRAALALRDVVAARAGTTLLDGVRLAVATGEALVPGAVDPVPQADVPEPGEVAEVAVMLLGSARLGAVRVCEATARAVRGFLVEPGRADVSALRDTPEGVPRPRLVERDRELARLRRALDEVAHRREPRVITVFGEPGMGKTRLLEEFAQSAAGGPVRVLSCRVGRFEWHRPLGALVDAVRPENARGHPAARQRVCDRTPVPARAGARTREVAADWYQQVRALAERSTTVLVVDDLHRAGRELLDVLDRVGERLAGLPVLVVAAARAELAERWTGEACRLDLDPLSATGVARLLTSLATEAGLLGGPDPMPGLAEVIEDGLLGAMTGGNPLLTVELVGHLSGRSGAPVVIPSAGPFGPPCGVVRLSTRTHAVVSAWLDTLPGSVLGALRDAAVFGDVVSPRALAALDPAGRPDAADALEHLVRRGLMLRTGRPEDPEYRFRHGIVRDVAYAQLRRAERAARHRAGARWLRLSRRHVRDSVSHHLNRAEVLEEQLADSDCLDVIDLAV